MFCKYCGSKIDDDSRFCSACGNRMVSSKLNDSGSPVNIIGNIRTSVTYTNSAFAGVKKMIKDHVLGVIVYCIWFSLNLIFLFGGHGYTHFWPYIHVENVYRPYYVDPLIHDITHMTIDWNLRYYGINEFIIYVFIIPLIICFIYLKRNPILSFVFPVNKRL